MISTQAATGRAARSPARTSNPDVCVSGVLGTEGPHSSGLRSCRPCSRGSTGARACAAGGLFASGAAGARADAAAAAVEGGGGGGAEVWKEGAGGSIERDASDDGEDEDGSGEDGVASWVCVSKRELSKGGGASMLSSAKGCGCAACGHEGACHRQHGNSMSWVDCLCRAYARAGHMHTVERLTLCGCIAFQSGLACGRPVPRDESRLCIPHAAHVR